MYQRSVVPIYDESHQYILGCTGRSIYNECDKCKGFHNPAYQCPKEPQFYPKWKHSKSLKKERCLFNFWFAKPKILESRVAILTESPGNVLRLEEAGIHVGLATMGTSFSEYQQLLLASSGCMSLIICGDNDPPGQIYNKMVRETCERQFNCYDLKISGSDLGSMSTEDIRKEVLPLLNKVSL